jgi:hypothetical protein
MVLDYLEDPGAAKPLERLGAGVLVTGLRKVKGVTDAAAHIARERRQFLQTVAHPHQRFQSARGPSSSVDSNSTIKKLACHD